MPSPSRAWRAGPLLGLLVGGVTLARQARAHVDYVAPESTYRDPLAFLGEVLSDPVNLALLGGSALAVTALALAWLRWGDRVPDAAVLVATLDEYHRFVPWMLRLSLGLPLVGAGFTGFLFTPVVETGLRVPLVLVGFLLLLGLATRAAAIAGLVGWLAALVLRGPELLLAAEYVPGLLAVALLGPGRPSADDLLASLASDPTTLYHRLDPVYRLAERVQAGLEPLLAFAPVIVRVGLGIAFVYFGVVEKLADPGPALALAYELGLPGLLPVGAGMWVLGAGLVETLVGVLLVLGAFTRAASATAFAVLTVTLFALPNDPVLPHVTLFGLTSVVFTLGAGPLSVDARLASTRGSPPARPAGASSNGG